MTIKNTLKHAGITMLAVPLLYGFGWLTVNSQKANSENVKPNLETIAKSSVVEEVENEGSRLVVENKDDNPIQKRIYTTNDYQEVQNILYGEAANQLSLVRKAVAKVILNRVDSDKYPQNIHDVIFERNAFSCIFNEKNKNWGQATGKLKRNLYEEKVYKECGKDAKVVLEGESLGLQTENEIVAYHDDSIKYEDLVAKELKLKEKYEREGKRYNGYWMNLEPVLKIEELTFYAPKKTLIQK
jgi:hypothetical protein